MKIKWDGFLRLKKKTSFINEKKKKKVKEKKAQWLAEVNKKDREAAKTFLKHLNSP